MLKVTLFGTPQITLDGQSLSDLITGRRLALFIYLVTSGRAHARDVLADLLWSNTTNRKARKNLRDALPTLRRYLSEYLVAGADTVAFNRDSYHWLDVEVFRSYVGTDLTTCNRKILHEVLDLYQDDFLGGFYVHRAPVFEEWVLQEREQLQKLAVEGLHVLANHYLAQDDYTAGLLITKRWLTLEPWREQAHRLQMSLLAKSGQRSAALEQYATCQDALQKEYRVDPLPETTRLYFEIKSGQLVAQRSNINRSSTVDHGHYTLKQQTSINLNAIPSSLPFYGREKQLAQLRMWVEQDRCRLITLCAMAGQGKTALITKLVHDWANSTINGGESSERFECILWYSLASQPTVTQIMHCFFRQLRRSPPENDLPESLVEQFALLIDCLRRQRCLLVLDHVEQIMPNNESEKIAVDYEMYNELWHSVAQNEHQSCLILISRTPPQELSRLERHNSAVRTLLLRGLSVEAGVTMLSESGLSTNESLLGRLVHSYSGHPLTLTLIRETLEELPDNEIGFFFEDGVIFDELYDLLAFEGLSAAEHDLLIWLAILGEPVDLKSLWSQFVQPYPKLAYLSAQRSLRRQGLLETELGHRGVQGAMTLPNIVQAYVTEHVVETITKELVRYQNTRQALGLEWLGNVLSVSGATTVTDEQEMSYSMLQKVNPNDLERWLTEQGSGLTYLNRYLLPLPLHESIQNRLVSKWGRDRCAKRLSDLLFKLKMQVAEVGYAQTNLANLLHFFPQAKTNAQSPFASKQIHGLPKEHDIIGTPVLSSKEREFNKLPICSKHAPA